MPLTLDETRTKIIQFTFLLATINSLIMFFVRIMEQVYDGAFIALTATICNLFIFYWSRKGNAQIMLIFGIISCLIFAFYEGYRLGEPLKSLIYFSLAPAVFAFLIKNRTVRIVYLIINVIAFFLLNLLSGSNEWSDAFTMIAVIIIAHLVVLFFIELMEKQQEELLLALNEKNTALDALQSKHDDVLLFTNMMNHDIKAPLNTIKGFTGLLQKEKQSERGNQYIKYIKKSLDSLDCMIGDLLALTKINTIELELSNTDLNHVIDHICDALEYDIQNKKVNIVKENLPEIQGNSEALRTVFQNLISNSIKYQPLDKFEHIPTITISHKNNGQGDIIFFKDNGIGMKEENVPQLFTPFKRFHSSQEYEGTGLGMSICKKIMEKHKGDIVYMPTDEAGSCFKLAFPKSSIRRA